MYNANSDTGTGNCARSVFCTLGPDSNFENVNESLRNCFCCEEARQDRTHDAQDARGEKRLSSRRLRLVNLRARERLGREQMGRLRR